ncbi:MAG: MBL fold metallo-hydrolase [Treponema sp.]|jgi:mRNA degradation ribonuclease J1/J2|nr:MBL fold metallo-hydrolase [Treponema sp.]
MTIRKVKSNVALTNSGNLEIFFIGAGSAFSKKNFQTNILIVKGSDHLLVDCGTLCSYALTQYNCKIADIQNILITHSHADHIGGLEEVALTGRYISNRKTKLFITDEYKKILWDQSLKGGCSYGEYVDKGFMSFDDYFTQVRPEFISDSPRPLYRTKVGSIDIKLYRTKHIPDTAGTWENSFYSVGILIDDRILFPGDTKFDKELLDWMFACYPIEWVFHDCQFFGGGVHASYEELKTLPDDMKKNMFLCHYGDNFKNFNPLNDGFAGFACRGHYYDFGRT